jgi:colanic acid biosynthesis glycosyl transferase WcaI
VENPWLRDRAAATSDFRSTVPSQAQHIIFVCLVFHPDSSASSILFTDLFRRLATDNTRVTVLCGFSSKSAGEGDPVLPRSEKLDGINIFRCGVRMPGKRNLFSRAISYSSFLVHAGWKLLRMGRNATVVGGTDPPFTSVALWLLSWIARIDYQCILLDVYPDGFVGLGTLRDTALLTRVWRRLNRLSYKRAKQITVIGRDMVTRLQREYGIDPASVAYIPHWGPLEVEGIDTSRRTLLQRLGLQDKFVVQYSGNMGLWHDMESFVHAADRLREDGRIHFLFIGRGRRRQYAEQLSRDLGLTNTTWLDLLPREQLAESLVACDVALISLQKGLEGVAVPSKLYGILASGRPLIAQVPRESEVSFVVQEENCGIQVEPGDMDGLVGAIQSLAHDASLCSLMGANALAAYRSKYTIDHAVAAFRSLWHIVRDSENPKILLSGQKEIIHSVDAPGQVAG